MCKDDVFIVLRSYRENQSRISQMKIEIELNKAKYEMLKRTIIEDTVSGTSRITGMPRSKQISDPTAELAVKVADGYESDEMVYLKQRNREIADEIARLELVLSYVDAWLTCLTPRERLVVEHQVLNGEYWRDVAREFEKAFTERYSVEGLKKIKDRALCKIYSIAA